MKSVSCLLIAILLLCFASTAMVSPTPLPGCCAAEHSASCWPLVGEELHRRFVRLNVISSWPALSSASSSAGKAVSR